MHEKYEPLHEEAVIQNQENLDEAVGPRTSSRVRKFAIPNDFVV